MDSIAAVVAEAMNKRIKTASGYHVSVEAGAGPRVFVTVAGAEGDLSALRKLRPRLAKIVREHLPGAGEPDEDDEECGDAFTYKITASNRDENLVITCEIIYP